MSQEASGKKLTDCPSNLKEAIDWILRVTGRDGHDQNSNGTSKLGEAVKGLLQDVESYGSEIGADIQKVMGALANGSDGLITKLADGLRQFIGYKQNGNGLIGVDGVAVSNDPLERLRDGVLKFIAEFLGQLKNVQGLNNHVNNINNAIKALNGGIGQGKGGFNTAVKEVDKQLSGVNSSKIDLVLSELKKVKGLENKPNVSDLASAVDTFMTGLLDQVAKDNVTQSAQSTITHVKQLQSKLTALLNQLKQDTGPIDDSDSSQVMTKIKSCYESLNSLGKTFTKLTNKLVARALVYASYNATSNFLTQLQTGYKSSYQGVNVDHVSNPACAKIFLSCLPLIFSNLQHLYWKCKYDNAKGGWKEMQLNGIGGQGADLKHFMDLMAFSAHWLNGAKKGSDVESVMTSAFAEFSTAASSGQSYADFLKKFRSNCLQKWQGASTSATDSNFLSGLYLCSTSYFRHQHQKNAAQARPPSSIREMLYWLSGLQFAPGYSELEKHIDNVATNDGLDVAISGSPNSNEKLTADQVTEYLTASCAFSSSVLGLIQGPGASQNNSEPWLFELFCNSAFQFKYPSGATLFGTLSNYAYALQFQLHFLYQQCSNTYAVGCGWRHCKFGKKINSGSDNSARSHICNGYTCKEPFNCQHNGSGSDIQCTHNKGGYGAKCGTDGKASPLQAFLTDNLHGFRRGHSGTSDHLATCSGYLCHVPMGFKADYLRAESNANTQGSHISVTLRAFCGGFKTPLRQLSEKLGCLTKRTPRTLGDLFGFTWHLNGQLFKTDRPTPQTLATKLINAIGDNPNTVPEFFVMLLKSKTSNVVSSPNNATGLSRSLEYMAPVIPFLYQLFTKEDPEFLPGALFDLTQQCHKVEKSNITHDANGSTHNHDCSTSPADLYSLYNPECKEKEKGCGPYLYPLTHSDGATFAPKHASAYLSWVLYLSDDLQSWFQDMLDEFKKIDCTTDLGCKTSCSHSGGQHGTSSCSCASVVQCGGTLPLLYRHGFRYNNPILLMGGGKGSDDSKRSCQKFHDALSNVLAEGAPLTNLLNTIDTFLYAIRWEFFSKLSGSWTIYICLILYTFFFLIDTLRVRSHLHFPSSNSIAPISLLGTEKTPALKKLTKLTYFIP
ncbi:variant erythrocyte surface antigen-1 family protein [Babesia caballi]|uniref:Variant erythrocyte surface antigen-1 family protein n=1 Tax=Babesia caballi TaxID=5871 RepID=A0AAV4LQ43_BABCB|nr:variant erythrocyte surface antigen-1 family protein [Babesia caballi]